MNILRPLTTECNSILAYSITQTIPTWSSATSYSKGAQVVAVGDTCGSTVYESIINNNLNNDPTSPDSALEWVPVGVSNYFAMFDTKNGTQTTATDEIWVVVSFTQLVNSVSLINLRGVSSARFEIWEQGQDWTKDAPIIDFTENLRDYGVTNWYEWFTYQVRERSTYVNFELPTFLNGVGRLTLSGSGEIGIGSLIYGNKFFVGDTLTGVTSGIQDFSTRELDTFGNYTIIERGYQDRLRGRCMIAYSNASSVKRVLADNRASPLVIAVEQQYDVGITYGFVTDWVLNLDNPSHAYLDFEIEGL